MPDLPSCLVVDSSVARVREVVLDGDTHTLVLTLESTPPTAACPVCGQLAHRIHSRYSRTLADASWALVPVRIHLHVRRFFCHQSTCPRRIFTERLPTITQPYARRTTQSVSAWLKAHPGVEIVTRDRSEAYAQGIAEGAPDALQVADRWHLLKNVTDALTTVLQDHRAAFCAT